MFAISTLPSMLKNTDCQVEAEFEISADYYICDDFSKFTYFGFKVIIKKKVYEN